MQDFEKTFARKLNPTDFYFNPQVGFLSLTSPCSPMKYWVLLFNIVTTEEFTRWVNFRRMSRPIRPATQAGTQKVLFLKLLKATSQRTNLPLVGPDDEKRLFAENKRWQLSCPAIQPDDFKLNILYEEPSLGQKRFLPEGDQAAAFR